MVRVSPAMAGLMKSSGKVISQEPSSPVLRVMSMASNSGRASLVAQGELEAFGLDALEHLAVLEKAKVMTTMSPSWARTRKGFNAGRRW